MLLTAAKWHDQLYMHKDYYAKQLTEIRGQARHLWGPQIIPVLPRKDRPVRRYRWYNANANLIRDLRTGTTAQIHAADGTSDAFPTTLGVCLSRLYAYPHSLLCYKLAFCLCRLTIQWDKTLWQQAKFHTGFEEKMEHVVCSNFYRNAYNLRRHTVSRFKPLDIDRHEARWWSWDTASCLKRWQRMGSSVASGNAKRQW